MRCFCSVASVPVSREHNSKKRARRAYHHESIVYFAASLGERAWPGALTKARGETGKWTTRRSADCLRTEGAEQDSPGLSCLAPSVRKTDDCEEIMGVIMFRRECRHAGFSLYRALIALATVFLVQLGCLVGAADEPKAEQKVEVSEERELERLRGTWVVTSVVANGKSFDSNFKYVFSKNRYVNVYAPGKLDDDPRRLEYEFELNLKGNKKVMRARPAWVEKDDPHILTHIYRFTGERLELCYYGDPKRQDTPPARFDGAAGSEHVLITLERVKGEQPKAKRR
jgi:uncharacterized protein (TIGR03067 family)